ncbi:hypothetical protein TNCV_1617981 [Trichonephila clavipes]|nr:hypothetical protein TNCV_1617981 [Trichonephila clavipes]
MGKFGERNLIGQSGSLMDASSLRLQVPVFGNWSYEIHVGILDISALPTLWYSLGDGPFLFQQDNCSIHTSRLSQPYFDEISVRKL